MAELAAGDSFAQFARRLSGRHARVMVACLNCGQVNLMRFSALFQSKPSRSQREGERPSVPTEAAVAHPQPAPAAQDLPEDLDARVRLLGEWQVSEY